MAYSKSSNMFHTILFSRGMALFILFLIVFVGFGVVSIAGKSIDAAKDRKHSEAQVAALQAKEADMSRKLIALDTPEGKEAALRDQFPVVAAGEHVVIISEAALADQSGNSSGDKEHARGGFWKFFTGLFK